MNYLLSTSRTRICKRSPSISPRSARRFPRRPFPTVSNEVLARGAVAGARKATRQHGVPACASCHGPHLPAWSRRSRVCRAARELYQRATRRLALRHAHGHRARLHADRRRALTESDVTAVAAWLASLPAPADPSPVPHGHLPMPLACGSEPQLTDGWSVRMPGHCLSIRGAVWLLAAGRRRDARASAPTPDSSLIAKGEYLARAGDCIACHTAPGGKLFAGGLPMATPFGTLYSPNITPDPADRHRQVDRRTDFYSVMHTGRFPTAGCSTRRCRLPPTPRSRAQTPTRSSPICARSRRCISRTDRTNCVSRTTSAR